MFIFICFFTLVTVKSSLTNLDLALQPGNVTSLYGSSSSHSFALSVHDAGDVNGDSLSDVIIGCPSGSTDAGIAYVIYGNKNGIPDITMASLDAATGFTIIGPTGSTSFGWSVSKAGDLNADGIGDIIIGALTEHADYSGAAYVVFGTRTPRTSLTIDPITLQSSGQGFTISGLTANANLGTAVSYLGDVNGDKLDDVIVGAYQAVTGYSGAAYVIFGRNPATTPITDITLTSPLSNTLGFTIGADPTTYYLGSSVSGAGDFNGDGINDIIVGALNTGSPGGAYIIYGRSGITDITVPSGLINTYGSKILGATNNDYLGWSVSCAGDFNNDGLGDVIIGAVHSEVAYVIFGKPGLGTEINLASTSLSSNNLGFKIYTTNTPSYLGYAVTGGGDLNGDKIDDLALTTLYSGSTGGINIATGYVIFGSSSFSDVNVASLSINQGITINNIGLVPATILVTPISYTGDVNGDGAADLVIGCPVHVSPPSIYGSAHVVYGIPVPKPSNSALQILGDIENFGTSIGRIVAMTASLFQSQSITTLWFVFLEQLLQYPKYLLIDYPPRLKNIYENQDNFQLFTIPYISQIPDELNNEINEYSLPQKFEEYGFDSSFLVNFWDSLMTLLIIIVLIVIALIADRCTISNQSLHPFFNRIKCTLKWNYIIAMFTGTFCDIALFTSFEMRTVHFDSTLEWISFFLCISANLVVLAVSIRVALIIKKFAKRKALPGQNRHRTRVIKTSQDELKSYQVVFEGFKDQTLKQQSYFLFFSLRFYLFYMIIGYLFEHTLVQAILINLIGISTLLYLVLVRPFTEKLDFVVSLSQEVALEIIHVCVLVFALDDQVSFASQNFRVMLGDIILSCNGLFMGSTVMYSFILVLILFKNIYVWISKKCCKQNKINSNNPNVVTSERMESRTPTASENKTELDKTNETQMHLYSEPTLEQELSNFTIHINQRYYNSNVLNNFMSEGHTRQITSLNTILEQKGLKLVNPREEERKRFDREKLATESSTKEERLNQRKRRKIR